MSDFSLSDMMKLCDAKHEEEIERAYQILMDRRVKMELPVVPYRKDVFFGCNNPRLNGMPISYIRKSFKEYLKELEN